VVGVNTAIVAGAQSLCFAVPSDTARWVLTEVLRHGRVRRAWLGIAAQTVPMPRRSVLHHGLRAASAVSVDDVVADSPAAQAGMMAGDRIVSVDGQATPDVDTLHRLLGGDQVGRDVRVELLRGPCKLALGLRPAQAPAAA
jgi:S1-C subfamily serine protease